jgi:putative nucleotidyltransferase with HDIG domain
MTRSLALFIAGLVAVSAVALAAASLLYGFDARIAIDVKGASESAEIALGVVFWTLVTLVASALPVRFSGGALVAVSTAPILAAMNLGGPAAAGWVALIGSTELRELRGDIPWFGSLSNHAGIVLPAVLAGFALRAVAPTSADPLVDLIGTAVGALVYFGLNFMFASAVLALRTGASFRSVVLGSDRGIAASFVALAPLAWLMTQTYEKVGWWTTALYALPLYMIRLANERLVEMREMFTQTIEALAHAVDKRDPMTANHSRRVKEIASDIGRVMRLNANEMEAVEWGGLLHDVGKIGVPDHVLLKEDRLTRDERQVMNSHPVLGAEIIAPVKKLAPELPIIRHHHEWYNGSGYPDRLLGDEIPKLARILHVADAFEAMTAARPYRKKPLTAEQALSELRKFAGIQFDPVVVDAFVQTDWVEGIPDPGRSIEPRPVPLLAAAAGRMASSAGNPQAANTTAGSPPATTGAGGVEPPAAPIAFVAQPEAGPRPIDVS